MPKNNPDAYRSQSDDWDKPTIIGQGRTRSAVAKGADLSAARRNGAALETTVKDRTQPKGPADHQRIAKLDRDDAPKPPEKVDMSVVKALAQARQDKKNADGKSMTQKDLATAVNAKPSDVSVPQLPSNPSYRRKLLETDGQRADAGRKIADLESGKAVPNQPLLIKLERVVGVKLRGAASLIGTPLNGPKKK